MQYWPWFWHGIRPASQIPELLGNGRCSTTMIYTHVLNVAGGVASPLDFLADLAAPVAERRSDALAALQGVPL